MKLIHKIIPVAAVLGTVALAATPALAYPARSSTDLNVRSGPGTQYDVVGQLSAGERVNVQTCNGGWCRVGGGWVSSNYLMASNGAPAYAVTPNYGSSYYDDSYDDGYYGGPPVSFGLSFGSGYGWRGGQHWGGGHWRR